MRRLETWGFISLISGLLLTTLSLTLLTGAWQIAGLIVGVTVGIAAGGLYAMSGQRVRDHD